MLFAAIALRNLARRPIRSVLTAGGIALALGSFVALVSLSHGVEHSWRRSLDERGTHLVVYERGTVEILTSTLPLSLEDVLRSVDGVRAAAGEIVSLAPVGDDNQAIVSGWAHDAYLWGNLNIVAGRRPTADETWVVVLGEALADALGTRPGERIDVLYHPFEIVGVARAAGVMNNGMMYVPRAALAELTHRTDSVTMINLALDRPGSPESLVAVRDRLALTGARAAVAATDVLARDNKVIGLLHAIAWSTSVIALGMGLLAVLNTLIMAVSERTREIGLLSAVGWSRTRILSMIVIEGLLLATAGGIVGIALGIGIARAIAVVPAVSAFLEPMTTLDLIVEAATAVLALGVLGSLYPAWLAARLDPQDALQR